jgi:hypothetical protein
MVKNSSKGARLQPLTVLDFKGKKEYLLKPIFGVNMHGMQKVTGSTPVISTRYK